jgi:hypothetical protein
MQFNLKRIGEPEMGRTGDKTSFTDSPVRFL